MKPHINDMKRRALHNADAAYYVVGSEQPCQATNASRWWGVFGRIIAAIR